MLLIPFFILIHARRGVGSEMVVMSPDEQSWI